MKTSYILCCLAVLFITIGCQHKSELPIPVQGNDTTTIDSTDTVEKKYPVDTLIGTYTGNFEIKSYIDGMLTYDTLYVDTIHITKKSSDAFTVKGAVFRDETSFLYHSKNEYMDVGIHDYTKLYIYTDKDSIYAEYWYGSNRASGMNKFFGKRQ